MGIIKNIARLLLKPIALNAVFFVTMYVLGVLCAFLTLPEQKGSHLYDNLFSELFLDIYFAVAHTFSRKEMGTRAILCCALHSSNH